MPEINAPTQQQSMEMQTPSEFVTQQPAAEPQMDASDVSLRGGCGESIDCCGITESCGCC